MCRRQCTRQLEFPDFYLPFSGHLCPENRWVQLARLVPWQLAAEIYVANLCEHSGQPIVPARVAMGALLINERKGFIDRQTVAANQKNPYLQFFIGLLEFTQDQPFDASQMVDFRKRFGEVGRKRGRAQHAIDPAHYLVPDCRKRLLRASFTWKGSQKR